MSPSDDDARNEAKNRIEPRRAFNRRPITEADIDREMKRGEGGAA